MKLHGIIQPKSLLKGLAYLGSAIGVLECSFRLTATMHYRNEWMHITTAPIMVIITHLFSPESLSWSRQDKKLILYGWVAGNVMYYSWLATIATQGGVHSSLWGWQMPMHDLINTITVTTFGHFAVAFNEELVFRGYGLTIWTKAIGYYPAVVFLNSIFALSHRPTTIAGLSGYFTVGIVLTSLRHISQSIWLPIGYHWGWNMSQLAILGHDERPSLRPVQISGSPNIVGQSSPETGWLVTIVNLLFLIMMWIWRSKKQKGV